MSLHSSIFVKRYFLFAVVLLILCISQEAFSQAGVVIPGNENKPDPSKLSLDEMNVDIRIDHQFARVKVIQIYGNHTDRAMESKYIFRLPTSSSISDFAVWDGNIRIPGVILEVKRANEIYEEIKRKELDPGLVTQTDEGDNSVGFKVDLAPIPAYGTKRVELEYNEILNVEGTQTFFSLPLKPSEYGEQQVGSVKISLELLSQTPMSKLNLRSQQYPLSFTVQEGSHIQATFQANDLLFKEDFAFDYFLQSTQSQLTVLSYRAPEIISPVELRDPQRTQPDNDGYFEASAIFNERHAKAEEFNNKVSDKRSVVVMLDTSLSMQWEKLDRAYQATEMFLKSLTPQDNFNLLLFNDDVNVFSDKPLVGTPENIEKALSFIKQSYLSGGTDLIGAIRKGIELIKQLPGDQRGLVLITDGNPTLTTTLSKRIVSEFTTASKSLSKSIVRIYSFGIGSDTNQKLLRELARVSRGYFDWGRETDDLEFRLRAFFSKVGQKPIESLTLTSSNLSNLYNVYPDVDTVSYDGSRVAFVGRYHHPEQNVKFTLNGQQAGQSIKLESTQSLPELDSAHNHLPRVWARQRVDALLRLIELNGEDETIIAEIIALSKKYKFVTPYTAFLAAPRSLLRPRVIKPGDPVLRVRTIPSIKSVVAVFPFGLTKPLTYLESENIWETRFLAPKEMQDGSYSCRLILSDDNGAVFQEEKQFVIDSHPPTLKAQTNKQLVRAGETVEIVAFADSDTRQITARLFGAHPVKVMWDEKRKANIGKIFIPDGMPSGSYMIFVTAEDFAHNVVSTEVLLDIIN